MADTKTYQMTREGFEELEAELDNLKLVKRAEVVERIKVARSYGDLSENSEYEAAKDEQAFVEGRIATVETMIRNAEIVDNAGVKSNEVALGKTVTFVEVGEDEKALDIVDKIVAAGVAPGGSSPDDGFPAAPISILSVAVTEKKA